MILYIISSALGSILLALAARYPKDSIADTVFLILALFLGWPLILCLALTVFLGGMVVSTARLITGLLFKKQRRQYLNFTREESVT